MFGISFLIFRKDQGSSLYRLPKLEGSNNAIHKMYVEILFVICHQKDFDPLGPGVIFHDP